MTDDFTLIDGFSEAFFLIDSDRLITRVNRSAIRLFGDNLLNQPFIRVLRHPQALECLDAAFTTRKKSSIQIHLSHLPSSRYRIDAYPYQDSMVALILQDISPLVEAAKMRSDFVANVSHELRSPLTTLMGLIETLQGPAKNDSVRQEQFLSTMQTEAQRMDRLVKDLLSLSKVEADEKIVPTTSIDLIPLIGGIVTNIESQSQEKKKKQDIIFMPTTETAFVLGDEDQLIQVFHNVLQNAVNYSNPSGKIKIELEESIKKPFVRHIHITDEGDGIESLHLPRLSERFYRVEEGRSREVGGTGLGLAIVKHILARHRGFMNISSKLGIGTKVTLTLPLSSPTL